MTLRQNHVPADESIRGLAQIWPVLMTRGSWGGACGFWSANLVRRLPVAWRVGVDYSQAQPSSVRNRPYACPCRSVWMC